VQQLAADSGLLKRVAGRQTPAGYEVLDLVFERGTLRLTCDGDTDEIVVDVVEEAADFIGMRDDEAFAAIIGSIIEQAWTLVNDRGYTDAFQLRLLDQLTRSENSCQFEVAASAITVARVTT
jgi:hypothetical protein